MSKQKMIGNVSPSRNPKLGKVNANFSDCDYKKHKRNRNQVCADFKFMKVIEKDRCKGFGFGARSWNVEPNHSLRFAEEKMNRIKEDNTDTLQLTVVGYRYHSDEELETSVDYTTPLDVLLAYERVTPYEVPEEKLGRFEGFTDSDFWHYDAFGVSETGFDSILDSILEDALNQEEWF